MLKIKSLMVVMLLVAAIGVGVPPSALADGPSETPGVTSTGPSETPGVAGTGGGPSETPGATSGGPSEPPSRASSTEETLSFFEMLLQVWSLTFLP